ncbi:MAG: DUF2834 domain-containing protein [Algiphilus sp.]|uniref:DUF2834 domain-containing protein n=1 Tax=Algiphilus sp. TaxID=1872431 RepID=UPI0032EEDE20
MSENTFTAAMVTAAALFTAFFAVVVVPPLIAQPDIIGAFAAGFVNPHASGYSTDVIVCWLILAAWVLFEARTHGVRHGWICLLLGLVPGVAVGFALYLLLRRKYVREASPIG